MDFAAERDLAVERVELYRARYRQFGDGYFPVQIALRWEQAVRTDPVDLVLLKEICDTAKVRQNEFDISFFAFCNHMEAAVRQAWRESFSQQDS